MATTSTRTTNIGFSGDVDTNLQFSAASNAASPAQVDLLTLASGDNTLTAPVTPVSVTIIPPAGNTHAILLKGNAADVGVSLHLTDPTTIALASSQTSIILNAAAQILGVRTIWT
jgi:hypothetical protein